MTILCSVVTRSFPILYRMCVCVQCVCACVCVHVCVWHVCACACMCVHVNVRVLSTILVEYSDLENQHMCQIISIITITTTRCTKTIDENLSNVYNTYIVQRHLVYSKCTIQCKSLNQRK